VGSNTTVIIFNPHIFLHQRGGFTTLRNGNIIFTIYIRSTVVWRHWSFWR